MTGRRTFLKQAATAAVLTPLAGPRLAWAHRQAGNVHLDGIGPTDTSGMRPHPIKQLAPEGLIGRLGESQFLHLESGAIYPFSAAVMDNGEIILLGSWDDGDFEKTIVTFSDDGGRTWSAPALIPDIARNLRSYGANRPVGLAYLGNGELCFQLQDAATRVFSHDYGRTWPERVPVVAPPGGDEVGAEWGLEGTPLVDRDANGIATRIAEVRWLYPRGATSPITPAIGMIHWSTDGGRTWGPDLIPPEWNFTDEYNGTSYPRGVSEGSLIRTRKGAIIAALRTDMPPRYFEQNTGALEGIGLSVSTDDGQTWSPVSIMFEAGRHHQQIVRADSGELVMTYVVREDVRAGVLASYRRGFEAILSRDDGRSWDVYGRYVLDDFEFVIRPTNWAYGACGHQATVALSDGYIVSAYANYLTNGITVVRWQPKAKRYRDRN